MDFFSRHTSIREPVDSAKATSNLMKKQQFLVPQTLVPNASKGVRPLAVSTPISLPKTTIDVQQKNLPTHLARKLDRPQPKDPVINIGSEKVVEESTSNHTLNSVAEERAEDTDNASSGTATTKQDDSTDSRMEMLYESLQTEAQKIQKFKVHAMAQMKQKSDEIGLKESQIKNLNSELSTAKTMNSTLVAQLRKQKHSNDDVMKKVATTREMCFALAEEHLAFKNLMSFGKSLLQEIKHKSSTHTTSVKDAIEQIHRYKASMEQQFLAVEQAAKSRQMVVNQLFEKHEWKENSLNEEIAAKNVRCDNLQETLDKHLEELKLVQEELRNCQKTSKQKEAELVAAMNELTLSQNNELSSLQERLDTTIASNAKSSEENLQQMETVKQELAQCIADWQATKAELQEELLRCRQISDEKVKCDEKLLENEGHITTLTQAKDELEQQLTTCREQLNDVNILLEQGKADFLTLEANSAELKAKLEQELVEKADAITILKAKEEQLTTNLAELDSARQQLELKCESLESANGAVTEKLKVTEDELVAATEMLDLTRNELSKVEEKLDSSVKDANTDHDTMSELMEKLKLDHSKEIEAKLSTVSTLEQQLKITESKLEQVTADHKESVAESDAEVASLKQLMDCEKQEYERNIKEKTTAFSEAQDAMQRLLDEAIADGKKQVEAAEELMSTRQAEYVENLKAKTDSFVKTKDELQKVIDEAERKMEQDALRMEDLNQEVIITKNSLDKSLEEKSGMAASLAKMTQELQVTSNELLAKDCEFNKLRTAVQNLKYRWAAVTTPMTPVATPPPIQQAAVKPTAYGTPLKQVSSKLPSTPTFDAVKPSTPVHPSSTTPLKQSRLSSSVTPKSNASLLGHSSFSTPHTPNSSISSDNPKGILRNIGSASKSNRVVFSTPIEQKNAVAPSESDTSVLDLEVVNKSLQLKSPQNLMANLSRSSNASLKSKNSPMRPEMAADSSLNKPATPTNQSHLNSSLSPALSSQSDRLPRSKMLKASNSRKRMRPPGKKEQLGMLSKAMKKHRALMGHPINAVKPVRESDSDCFGFGSE